MAPYIAKVAVRSWNRRQESVLSGFTVDTTGEYDRNLPTWLTYFGFHYMKPYFAYFAFLALLAGSVWGSRRRLNLILFGWCATLTLFLAYFVAVKNFQYLLPVAVPLLCAPFLLPSILDAVPEKKQPAFLAKPLAARIVRGLTIAMIGSQWIINLVILALYAIRGH